MGGTYVVFILILLAVCIAALRLLKWMLLPLVMRLLPAEMPAWARLIFASVPVVSLCCILAPFQYDMDTAAFIIFFLLNVLAGIVTGIVARELAKTRGWFIFPSVMADTVVVLYIGLYSCLAVIGMIFDGWRGT